MENVREERQEVRFVGQRKIDGQVRSRMAKRKKTAKEVETLSQQYRSTSRKAEFEAMIKSRWENLEQPQKSGHLRRLMRR